VGKKPDHRCSKTNAVTGVMAMDACPSVCNSKCTNTITTSPTSSPTQEPCADIPDYVVDNNKPHKTCKWVGKKPDHRCSKTNAVTGVMAMDACPSVCNSKCTDAITTSPTSSPTREPCADIPDYVVDNNKPHKTCEWVGDKPDYRCSKTNVVTGVMAMDACSSVCNSKCTNAINCRDSDEFTVDDKKPHKNCDWVGKKPDHRCSKTNAVTGVMAKDACPSMCESKCKVVDEGETFVVLI
jgi:hypothetical protein